MKKGFSLLMVIFFSAILMVLGAFTVKMVYNTCVTVNSLAQREQAFWLAEAGLEAGKVMLAGNPGWYTDLSHYPEDDLNWLKLGAVGFSAGFGEGQYKIVREQGKGFFYSLGIKGRSVVVLKIEFSCPPFKKLKWVGL